MRDWSNYKKLLEAGNYDMCYCEVRLGGDLTSASCSLPARRLNYGAVSDTQLDRLIAPYLAANDDERKTACGNMCAQALQAKAYIVAADIRAPSAREPSRCCRGRKGQTRITPCAA